MDKNWLFESENLKYRAMTLDDTESVLMWRNSDVVRQYFFYQDIITEATHIDYYHNQIEKGYVAQYIIADKKSEKEIGCVYFSHIDSTNKSGESGIFIGDSCFQNIGLGSEALKALTDYGFSKLGFERIDMRVKADNIRSIKAHEKVGYIINNDIKCKYGVREEDDGVVFMSIWKEM